MVDPSVIRLRRMVWGRPGQLTLSRRAIVVDAPAFAEPWRLQLRSLRGWTYLDPMSRTPLPMPHASGRLWSANIGLLFVHDLPCPPTRITALWWKEGGRLPGLALAVRDPGRAGDLLEGAGLVQLDGLDDEMT